MLDSDVELILDTACENAAHDGAKALEIIEDAVGNITGIFDHILPCMNRECFRNDCPRNKRTCPDYVPDGGYDTDD